MGEASTANPVGRRGDRVTLKCWHSFEMALVADAEGLNAPEGNTSASVMARMGRSAGVLRPWHAGREASKNVGGPKRSCPWKMTVYGIQLLRHGRGNPDTEQCWNLSVAVKHGAGRWRSTVRGKAHRMRLGSRIEHSTLRWGKPTTRGRSRRKHAARKGHASRTCRTGSDAPTSLRAHRKQGFPLRGSECNRGTGCGKTARPGLYGLRHEVARVAVMTSLRRT